MAIHSFLTAIANHWFLITVVVVLVVAAVIWFSMPLTWRNSEGLPIDTLERRPWPDFGRFSGSRDEPWIVWLFRQLF